MKQYRIIKETNPLNSEVEYLVQESGWFLGRIWSTLSGLEYFGRHKALESARKEYLEVSGDRQRICEVVESTEMGAYRVLAAF